MEPIIRAGTEHEESDRRLVVACMLGAAPVAAVIGTLMYWLI
jgi:hypothetical protein